MAAGFDFSWAQFLWIVLIFVGVPTLIGVSMVWVAWQRERAGVRSPSSDHEQTGDRPVGLGLRGLWATGATAFALGFLSCAGWLSWSAEHDGEFGP